MQDGLFVEKSIYIFDTSSFVTLRQFYPEDIFEPLHDALKVILESGKVVLIDMVLEELRDKEPKLYTYLKVTVPKGKQLSFETYIVETQRIIQSYYDSKGKSHKLKADPHIISCAKAEGLKIVTEELNSDVTKIPYVCGQEKVDCINLIDFMRKEKIKL